MYNEIALFSILVFAVIYKFFIRKSKDFKLFVIGTILGFLIEWYMGTFSRNQHWENTLFLDIPIWLPIAWGYGFVVIYEIGKALENKD